MEYVQKYFCKEDLCALQVFLCALVSWLVCARTCAQPREDIAHEPLFKLCHMMNLRMPLN